MTSPISVAICTPVRGGASVPFVSGLVGLTHALRSNGIEGRWIPVADLPVAQARHRLVTKALASGCSHALWIDADGSFPPDTMGALIACDADMVTLPCVCRPREEDTAPPPRSFNVSLVDLEQTPERGAVKVEWSGFGAVFMRRTVLEKMVQHHPELTCYEGRERVHTLFAELTEAGIRWSEDLSFCRRWRALGGEIHALLDVETNHAGLVGHFGREVWAHRAELAELRDEMIGIDTEARPLRSVLVEMVERAPAGADLAMARALLARVPPERTMARDVNGPPAATRMMRDFMRTMTDAMRDEVARLRPGVTREAAE